MRESEFDHIFLADVFDEERVTWLHSDFPPYLGRYGHLIVPRDLCSRNIVPIFIICQLCI